ncbi:MAG TPA: tol-pal system protein YbgF [Longimicrobiaceae bacterium]|jgi:tol-pal system protein YbgF|nr:tol-pal system protein YbgF [Longimicrobiaceae bacterium]
MRARAILSLVVLPTLGGCLATQSDVRLVRGELVSMQQRQASTDSLIRSLQRQMSVTLDSLSSQGVRSRGDLANRLLQMERQLVQIQELTGQGQAQVVQLRAQLDRQTQELARQQAAAADSSGGSAPQPGSSSSAASGTPEEIYNAALGAYRRGSFATARAGFEEMLRTSPQNRLAPDAQYYVGETYAQTRDPGRALDAFDRVTELYPTAPKAATALFRAAQIELARGNRAEARARFNEVVRAYPRAPEATQARQELARLN